MRASVVRMEWPSFDVFIPKASRKFGEQQECPDNFKDKFEDLQAVSPKKARCALAADIPSMEWPEVSGENNDEGSQIVGVITSIKTTVRGRWKKVYIKRGTDNGVCLFPNPFDISSLRINMLIAVVIEKAIGVEFDKEISSLLCTRGNGVLASDVTIMEGGNSWPWLCFPWEASSLKGVENVSLADCQNLVQSSVYMRIFLTILKIENEFKYKGRKQQWMQVMDCKGVKASFLLPHDWCGIWDVKQGDRFLLSGFTIGTSSGGDHLRLFVGQNGMIECASEKQDLLQQVPEHTVSCLDNPKIKNSFDEMEVKLFKDSQFNVTFESVLLTAINIDRGVFGHCQSCHYNQLYSPACRKCKKSPLELADVRYNLRVSIADDTGEWSGLVLGDVARDFIGISALDYLFKTSKSEKEQINEDAMLTWCKVSIIVTASNSNVHAEIMAIERNSS